MEDLSAQCMFETNGIALVPDDNDEDIAEEDSYIDGEHVPFLAYMSKSKNNVIHIGGENHPYFGQRRKHRSTIRLEDLHATKYQTDLLLMSPEQRLRSQNYPNSKKERTPRTLLKMMERHRENERVRHHSLNESMKNVCSHVPGSENLLRETKVVMMQRIITYICFLENTINDLCTKFGVKVNGYHLNTNFLTDQWKGQRHLEHREVIMPKSNKTKVKQRTSRKTTEKIEKRRLKLSSPTIDSTTDSHGVAKHNSSLQYNSSSQDSHNDSIAADIFLDDNACCVPDSLMDTNSYIFQHDDFLPTSTSYDNFPDPFDLMSSPLGTQSSLLSPKVKSMDNELSEEIGIKSDKNVYTDTVHDVLDHEMRTISPESVLPSRLFKPVISDKFLMANDNVTNFADSTDDQIVPEHKNQMSGFKDENFAVVPKTPTRDLTSGKNKRKQYTPKRSPLQDVSNLLDCSDEESLPLFVGPKIKRSKPTSQLFSGKIIKENDNEIVSYLNPYTWKFHNATTTRRQKAEVDRTDKSDINESLDKGENAVEKREKVDHRKTTWMNGFMMYSRLNRRKFIEANPGVHTSSISKMMGHTWRQMSDHEQGPYKEKARNYAEYIKSESLVPDVTSTGSEASNDDL